MLYPIGVQSFEEIRRGGYVYVDKTRIIYDLAHTGKYYFLSRPRRFGKSLLVSTMEAYFKGKKELFDGLEISKLEKEWTECPVIHIDFTGKSYSSIEDLDSQLDKQLSICEKLYDAYGQYNDIDVRFQNVIDAAYAKTGRQVAILIDEYDKPIVDNLGDEPLVEAFRKELQGFYSVMKSKDQFIRLGFLTGVTKIGKLSVFSGLNNLQDISMLPMYSDICGISKDELRQNFDSSVGELAEANGLSKEDCYEKLRQMYDGYHFSVKAKSVYNPFSLLNTFKSQIFSEYWFETCTPSFLVKVMKETDYDVTQLSGQQADSTLLTDIDSVFLNPIPLLYQSGYLTIKGYDNESGIYTLDFPNMEVKHGFLTFILNYYTTSRGSGSLLIRQMGADLRGGKPEMFMKRMEAFFAKQNYQIQGDSEKDFHYAMSIILQLLGDSFTVRTENATSEGRMDISIEAPKFIYIIEIKINDTAEAALKQIEEKGYARPFKDDPRKLFRIGVRFSTSSRCIDQWKVE